MHKKMYMRQGRGGEGHRVNQEYDLASSGIDFPTDEKVRNISLLLPGLLKRGKYIFQI